MCNPLLARGLVGWPTDFCDKLESTHEALKYHLVSRGRALSKRFAGGGPIGVKIIDVEEVDDSKGSERELREVRYARQVMEGSMIWERMRGE